MSAASLAVLVVGVAALGSTILVFALQPSQDDGARIQVAVFAAMTVVAAPIWAFHLWLGRRYARRDPSERASALRRLYLYFALFGLALAGTILLGSVVSSGLQPVDSGGFDKLVLAQSAWAAVVVAAFWALHSRFAGSDRALAGEAGASATLRRWYVYGALLIGLLLLLAGISGLLSSALLRTGGRFGGGFAAPVSELIAGFVLWGYHARLVARDPLRSDDLHSTLRALEGFLAVFIVSVLALVAAAFVLHYLLARALGVAAPGASPDDAIAALAGPITAAPVYAAAWILLARRLRRDAAGTEAARQAGVRRLYTNLVALVSLGALGVGIGGVLWTLLEQLEARVIGVSGPDWQDTLSSWVTMLVVGAAVWIRYWRPAPAAPERQALSRRLYLYAALVISVLALLASAVGVVNAVFREVFSPSPKLADPANLDFGRFLGVLAATLVVGLYHWRALRADQAARPEPQAPEGPPVPIPGVHYDLEVVGAGLEDLRRALAGLPPGSTYSLSEQH